jgi:hypothetical protein
MTMIANGRPAQEPGEAVELYQHLVRDHGWDQNPNLLSQRLREMHRAEHIDADSGVVRIDHIHDRLAAT